MIPRRKLPELAHFADVERAFELETMDEFAQLVVPNGNATWPIHRWFKYKEAFSSRLLGSVLRHVAKDVPRDFSLLDPFCGVGTTLVAAQELSSLGWRVTATGIECSPFASFVARTKIRWPEMAPEALAEAAASMLRVRTKHAVSLPALSSIASGRCISKHTARRIVQTRSAISGLPPSPERDALLLGLAAAIEPLSKVRRDGRALRIVEKGRRNFREEVSGKWAAMAEDVRYQQKELPSAPSATVVFGDGRRPRDLGVQADSMDLVLTSPPYPNNIDYNEVYKLELWLLGFTSTSQEFLALRRSTFRSHPTCAVLEDTPDTVMRSDALRTLLRPLQRKLRRFPGGIREKVLFGYCHDQRLALEQQYACLRKGGYAIQVVGNSLHGGADIPYVIPTDLIVAAQAEAVGFTVEKLLVARSLKRRLAGNHFLRETLVVLRKP